MNAPESYSKPTIDLKRFRWLYILLGMVLVFYLFQLFSYQVINGAGTQYGILQHHRGAG